VPEALGPMFETYFRNATLLAIEDPTTPATLLDIARIMSDKTFRDLKLSRSRNPIVNSFWRDIAEKTGGKFYRARSGEELEKIYGEIDKLEKTEIEVASHIQYKELFYYFAYAGLAFLVLEIVLANSYFRKLP
jgi:hypothetical protein